MLLQFVLENHRSFRDRTVLSLLPSPETRHPGHLAAGRRQALRCAALYGANASGKSNLVQALGYLRQLVLGGVSAEMPILVTPFKLEAQTRSAPVRFELIAEIEEAQYHYGVLLDPQRVLEEWLVVVGESDEQLFFEREGERITFGPAAPAEERRQFLQFVAQGTRPNQLFLREAEDRNVTELRPLLQWFRALQIITPHSRYQGLARRVERDEPFRDALGALLFQAGTGVKGVTARRVEDRSASGLAYALGAALGGALKSALRPPDANRPEVDSAPGQETYAESMGDEAETIVEEGLTHRIRLQLEHTAADGQTVALDLAEESDGTRRLLHLAPVSLAREGVFVIDELDRSLHTLLVRAFLEGFLATPGQSQILFTTHDTNLLDLNLLRPDEIWFIEKDPAGRSALYSLSEFKADQIARLGPELEQGYLSGRFGAIPFLGDPRRLGWTPP